MGEVRQETWQGTSTEHMGIYGRGFEMAEATRANYTCPPHRRPKLCFHFQRLVMVTVHTTAVQQSHENHKPDQTGQCIQTQTLEFFDMRALYSSRVISLGWLSSSVSLGMLSVCSLLYGRSHESCDAIET